MPPVDQSSSGVARALLLGTIAVGVLDGLDAAIFFGLRGVPVDRIFQAIASGLLGPVAFTGGVATVLLGILLHFLIAFGIVLIYYLASRSRPFLHQRPVVFGAIYGIVAYIVMNYVVIPLSAAGNGSKSAIVVVNGVLIHIVGVGIPAAFAARAARRGR